MTGNDIFTRSMLLLGYNDSEGSVSGEKALKARALEAINRIGFELGGMPPTGSLEDEIILEDSALDAMPYGVGMLLAVSDCDGGRAELFRELYSLKKAAVKAKRQSIRDNLPVCGG